MSKISHLLNQNMTVYNKTTNNRYGRENHGAGTTAKCRFQEKDITKLMPNGDSITLSGLIFAEPDLTISNNDRVTYNSVDYRVHAVAKSAGFTGAIDHLEIEVSLWQM